nr:uncharacterized protein LOC127489171 isoform X8 [Oryctolagus cuniculus]
MWWKTFPTKRRKGRWQLQSRLSLSPGCVEIHPHWKGQMSSCLSSRMMGPTCSVDFGQMMMLKLQSGPVLGPGTLQPSSPSAVLRPLWWKTPTTKRRKWSWHLQTRPRLSPGWVKIHPHWKGQMPSCLSSRMTGPTCSVHIGQMNLKHQTRPGLGPGTLQPSNPSAVLRPLWWKTPQTKRRKSRGHPQIRLRLCPGWVKIHPHWKGQMSSCLSSRVTDPTCSVDFGLMILKHQSRPVLSSGTLQPRSPFAVLKPLRRKSPPAKRRKGTQHLQSRPRLYPGCVEIHPHWKGQMSSCLSSRMMDPTCSVDTGQMSLKHQSRPGLGLCTLQPSSPSAVAEAIVVEDASSQKEKIEMASVEQTEATPRVGEDPPPLEGPDVIVPILKDDGSYLLCAYWADEPEAPVQAWAGPCTLQPSSPSAVLRPFSWKSPHHKRRKGRWHVQTRPRLIRGAKNFLWWIP